MGQKDFINGTVFEFKLPLNLGYGYCKILDFRHIRLLDGVLGKVYDYIVDKPLKDFKNLEGTDLLFGPRRMHALPNSRGKGAWKMKGVLISKDDDLIPDFKYAPLSSPLIEDESEIKDWYVNKNIFELSDKPYTYDQVKHLENLVINTQIGIEIRSAMEVLRKRNEDVREYFDLEDMRNWNCYRSMINVPIYSSIPIEIRGKAL